MKSVKIFRVTNAPDFESRPVLIAGTRTKRDRFQLALVSNVLVMDALKISNSIGVVLPCSLSPLSGMALESRAISLRLFKMSANVEVGVISFTMSYIGLNRTLSSVSRS